MEGIPRSLSPSTRDWNSSAPVRNPGTITAAFMSGNCCCDDNDDDDGEEKEFTKLRELTNNINSNRRIGIDMEADSSNMPMTERFMHRLVNVDFVGVGRTFNERDYQVALPCTCTCFGLQVIKITTPAELNLKCDPVSYYYSKMKMMRVSESERRCTC